MCGQPEPSFAHFKWNCEHTTEFVEQCNSRPSNRAAERLLCRVVPLRRTAPSIPGLKIQARDVAEWITHSLQKSGDLFFGTDGGSKDDIATWVPASANGGMHEKTKY